MSTFEKLDNRYELECTLHAEEGLHIGTGIASTSTNAPFITQMGGETFLPGSSLRGAMRATIERIVRSLFVTPRCCILFEDNDAALCDAGNKDRRKMYESASGKKLDELIDGLHLCPMCELFGSTLKVRV